jgi:hypothetical protein
MGAEMGVAVQALLLFLFGLTGIGGVMCVVLKFFRSARGGLR